MKINYTCSKIALNVDIINNTIYASINPYFGCYHKCKYCYVQSEKYSKTEFIGSVKVKYNIIDLLIKELPKYLKNYTNGVIYLGTSCDPYQIIEKQTYLSNNILKFLFEHTPYNIHIFTKSELILRDISLLKKNFERTNISVTIITTQENIRKIFEPNAPNIDKRLKIIQKLSKEKINCGCSIMPILPYITDSYNKIKDLLFQLKIHNCRYIWWDYLTLRENIKNNQRTSQRQIFYEELEKHFPGLIYKYEKLYNLRSSPNRNYQKQINKLVSNIANKYKISTKGPVWNKINPTGLLFNS